MKNVFKSKELYMKKTLLVLFCLTNYAFGADIRISSKESIIKEEKESFKLEQANFNKELNLSDSYADRMRAYQDQKNRDTNRLSNGFINIQIPLIWYAEKF